MDGESVNECAGRVCRRFDEMTQEEFDSAFSWVLLLSGVEAGGFCALSLIIYRLHGRSPIRQLCFVIKQHSWLLTSSVMLMFVYTVALIVKQNNCSLLVRDA